MHFQPISVFLSSQMTSNICQRLLNKVWRSYAHDLGDVPEAEGIYAIGNENGTVLYVGQSEHMRTRLRQHKYGRQDIDQFVRQEFAANSGINLRIKWVEDPNHKCVEGEYLVCIASKLGYWPRYNKQKGNNWSKTMKKCLFCLCYLLLQPKCLF